MVQNAKTVTVTMLDGKTLDAKVIATDPKTDLAVIKVNEAGDYPFVTFAKEKPRIGDWVVAIGNPYGLGGTVTAGIISADGRDIGDGPYDRFLQIDAPINRGNSGGPTFNMQGEVVGVNTAIYLAFRRQRRHRLRHSAQTAENVVDALEHGGVVSRGYLGVNIQPVTRDRRQSEHEVRRRRDRRSGHARNPGRRRRPQVGRRHHQARRQGRPGCGRPQPSRRLAQAGRQGRIDLYARRRREDGAE